MNAGTPHILLVEDDSDHELLTLRALKRSNVLNEVKVARDGPEALAMLLDPEAALPQLILLDLHLPKLNGIEVLRRLRESEQTKAVPVIVLTSSDEEAELVQSYCLGVSAFLKKPVAFLNLIEVSPLIGLQWVLFQNGQLPRHSSDLSTV